MVIFLTVQDFKYKCLDEMVADRYRSWLHMQYSVSALTLSDINSKSNEYWRKQLLLSKLTKHLSMCDKQLLFMCGKGLDFIDLFEISHLAFTTRFDQIRYIDVSNNFDFMFYHIYTNFSNYDLKTQNKFIDISKTIMNDYNKEGYVKKIYFKRFKNRISYIKNCLYTRWFKTFIKGNNNER